MAGTGISPAKAVLLAVQLASRSDLSTLRSLVSQHRKTLHTELVLRILLSHLPESLDSSAYVPFFEDLISGRIVEDAKTAVDASTLLDLTEVEAQKKVRKLHLLPLAWPNCPADAPADPIVLFLIHRALRIDESTGLITQLPELLAPFLHYSDYLRTWMISTILPLLRFNYDYHLDDGAALTIAKFEALDDRAGVSLLLSKAGKERTTGPDPTVGRDLKGLVGPWLYGDKRWKQRKVRGNSSFDLQSLDGLDKASSVETKYAGWEEVFKWLLGQAGTSWKTAVEAVEQWDGPTDVDLGGYEDGTKWLAEYDEIHLEQRYARSGLAAAYLISDESEEALNGVQRILARMITLLDKDRIPTLQAAAALLSPVPDLKDNILCSKSATYLRNDLLEDRNILTTPKEEQLKLVHALLISAFLCTRAGCSLSVRRAGELVFLQDERDQKLLFSKLMSRIGDGPKTDDKYWMKIRNEILWLRSWGAEELLEGSESINGKGVFGQLPRELIEAELLKALLANTRKLTLESPYIQLLISPYRLCTRAINLRDFTRTTIVQEGSP
jgi:protein transport protein SEC39